MSPDALTKLGRAVADEQDSLLAQTEEAAGLDSRVAALHAAREEKRRVRAKIERASVVAVALALVACVAFVLRPREPALAFVVGPAERSGVTGEWVAAETEPLPLRFSDGSVIRLDRAARGRIGAVRPRGATLVLDRGNAHVEVVHREGNDWHVTAGPFDVHVTGTTFDAHWDPSRDELTIAMKEGKVVVTGACAENGVSVAGGDTHRFSCPRAQPTSSTTPVERGGDIPPSQTTDPLLASARADGGTSPPPQGSSAAAASSASLSEPEPEPGPRARGGAGSPMESPSTTATTVSAAPSAPIPRGSASVAAGNAQTPDHRALIARGAYAEAIQEAERVGFDAVCASSTAHELEALGDAARLSGKTKRASEAYLAVRARFPGSQEAATAAFQLGRLAHLASPTSAEAKRWFGTYLSDSPQGSFAAQALGRVLEIESREGSPSARDTAARYLARYPTGAHARLANETLGRREVP